MNPALIQAIAEAAKQGFNVAGLAIQGKTERELADTQSKTDALLGSYSSQQARMKMYTDRHSKEEEKDNTLFLVGVSFTIIVVLAFLYRIYSK